MPDAHQDFWARASKEGSCWLWQGPTHPQGYGRYKGHATHRLSYTLVYGQPAEDSWILHSCDTPACINPAHLREGNARDNSADCKKRGRTARGVKAAKSKLTPDAVRNIRRLWRETEISQTELAKQYEVSPTSIHKIIYLETWKHVA